jgi:V8-like Glu-specific endopeptidase
MSRLSRFPVFGLIFIVALMLGASASAAPGKQKASERATGGLDVQAAVQERQELSAWLRSERVAEARTNPVSVFASDAEKRDIDLARGEVPVRVGMAKPVSRNISFGDVRLKNLRGKALVRDNGALRETDDGGYVYTVNLSSPGATGLRVHFEGFSLPRAAGVYLFTDDGQVFGPYTGQGPHGDGEFWSHTLIGEQVHLQLRHVGPASDADLRATSFRIADIAHIRPRFLGGQCSANAACVESVGCNGVSMDPAVNDSRDAVAHMQYVSGGWIYVCSGGLIADSDQSTEIPYFLTANHCISKDREARSLENFFKWVAPCGDVNCDDIQSYAATDPNFQLLRTSGASVRSSSRSSDYTLLELSEPAPAGTAFLGWDSTPVAEAGGLDLFRISHPAGAAQAYSEHDVDASTGTCRSWPRGRWIYSRDTFGATEGGSSGSPVVNSAGQVVGQLSGGCGYNVGDVCDTESNATVDGAFAAYFSDVELFLGSPAQCTQTETQCSNGVDDDCDGLTDDADPDCPSDPGGGGEPGDACKKNSDCASNQCVKAGRGVKQCT